ncbi:MAG: MFS transporter [Alphaproteobacteria bacterium]|nr:MFS transporter [Alphaproteobacteria bacterium]
MTSSRAPSDADRLHKRPPGAASTAFTRNVRLLLAARTARSLGQGVTVASFSLYLHALGYSGGAIGTVLMAGLMFGAMLTAIVGPLSDRRSQKRMLLGYEVAAAAAALAAMLSKNEAILIFAATIAGFGRGANGAAGPFAPVEQAWIARELEGAARRRALSVNATLGFLGMGFGAASVAVPGLMGHGFADLASYRLLFLVPFVGSLAALALLFTTEERTHAAVSIPTADTRARDLSITREENRQLRRLATANAINGFAIGIIGPLIAYWFARRFAQGPTLIGPAMALTFFLGAVGSGLNRRLADRIGTVRSVLWMRGTGLVLMIATALATSFPVAVGLYASRALCNQGTAGARQAVAADLTRAERRGLAASVQSLSLQIPRAAGPILGGMLIHSGAFVLPFLMAAGLQAIYLVLYGKYFGALDARP